MCANLTFTKITLQALCSNFKGREWSIYYLHLMLQVIESYERALSDFLIRVDKERERGREREREREGGRERESMTI